MSNPMSNAALGQRVKQLRLQKGLTLKMIEAEVGVSATHVSEVERGRTSPTVGALCKIAKALGVNPSHLIDFPIGDEVSVTEPGKRLIISGPIPVGSAEVLTQQQPHAEITFLIGSVNPGFPEGYPRDAHPGEKLLFVLEGTMEVLFGDDTFVLRRGDSLHFKATLPQIFRNPGDVPCRFLWADWPRYKI